MKAYRKRRDPLLNKPETAPCHQFNKQLTVNIEKKKIQLIEKLNQVIDNLNQGKKFIICTEDPLILALENIEQEAKFYELKEIAKMANLAIGKRILNMQLDRKKTEIQNKLQKKKQIQEYFRQNRIKKTSYEQIALQKLKDNIFIVKPYADGKGFIQSTTFYQRNVPSLTAQNYDDLLQQSNYLAVVKQVNKIFFNNFSNSTSEQSRKQAASHPLLKIGLVLVFTVFILCVYLGYTDLEIAIISYIIAISNILLVILMGGLALWNFCQVKIGKNLLEATVLQINQYFTSINDKNRKKGARFQWYCPQHLLYLQLKFDDLD